MKERDIINQRPVSSWEQEAVNGFVDWIETYHEIALSVERALSKDGGDERKTSVGLLQQLYGASAIPAMITHLTNKFEKLNEGREWDGEFWDEVWEFVDKEMKLEK